ncbi:unnamed protein product [Closterium sp. Yama58-4]|nr:unnamed protein product [Closterium sp. Yama58-4]
MPEASREELLATLNALSQQLYPRLSAMHENVELVLSGENFERGAAGARAAAAGGAAAVGGAAAAGGAAAGTPGVEQQVEAAQGQGVQERVQVEGVQEEGGLLQKSLDQRNQEGSSSSRLASAKADQEPERATPVDVIRPACLASLVLNTIQFTPLPEPASGDIASTSPALVPVSCTPPFSTSPPSNFFSPGSTPSASPSQQRWSFESIALAAVFGGLRRLAVVQCGGVGEEQLRAVLRACRVLVELRVEHSDAMSDKVLLSCPLHSLTHATLIACNGITAAGVIGLLASFPRLMQLKVEAVKVPERARRKLLRAAVGHLLASSDLHGLFARQTGTFLRQLTPCVLSHSMSLTLSYVSWSIPVRHGVSLSHLAPRAFRSQQLLIVSLTRAPRPSLGGKVGYLVPHHHGPPRTSLSICLFSQQIMEHSSAFDAVMADNAGITPSFSDLLGDGSPVAKKVCKAASSSSSKLPGAAPAPAPAVNVEVSSAPSSGMPGKRFRRLCALRDTVGETATDVTRDLDTLAAVIFPENLADHRKDIIAFIKKSLRRADFKNWQIPTFKSMAGENLKFGKKIYARQILQFPNKEAAEDFAARPSIFFSAAHGPDVELKVYVDPAPDFTAAKARGETSIPMLGDAAFSVTPPVIWIPDVREPVLVNLSCHSCGICSSNHRTGDHHVFPTTRRNKINNPYSISVAQLQNVNAKALGHSPAANQVKQDPALLFIGLDSDVEVWTCCACDFVCGWTIDTAIAHGNSSQHLHRLRTASPLLKDEFGDMKVQQFLKNDKLVQFFAEE